MGQKKSTVRSHLVRLKAPWKMSLDVTKYPSRDLIPFPVLPPICCVTKSLPLSPHCGDFPQPRFHLVPTQDPRRQEFPPPARLEPTTTGLDMSWSSRLYCSQMLHAISSEDRAQIRRMAVLSASLMFCTFESSSNSSQAVNLLKWKPGQ